jgi:hypothetical protein
MNEVRFAAFPRSEAETSQPYSAEAMAKATSAYDRMMPRFDVIYTSTVNKITDKFPEYFTNMGNICEKLNLHLRS